MYVCIHTYIHTHTIVDSEIPFRSGGGGGGAILYCQATPMSSNGMLGRFILYTATFRECPCL